MQLCDSEGNPTEKGDDGQGELAVILPLFRIVENRA